jgi:mono/diheme cytochrome c family protein
MAAPKSEKQCFHCHAEIEKGAFTAPSAKIEAHWKDVVADLVEAPSLTSSQKRFKRGWIKRFLLEPYDLRPHLAATMPRLAITETEARDIAAYLGAPDEAPNPSALAGADATRGRAVMEAKGCPSCHVFTGVPPLAGESVPKDLKGLASGVSLAPDFRTTRKRMSETHVLTWIKSPKAMKPDTAMPELALTDAEIKDVAAFILTTKLTPPPEQKAPERLPLLTRKVGFDEVSQKIFRRTCWHCHGEPEYSAGDGGPGNTGGFGFKPRGLSLTDYANVSSGFVDDQGERHSAFEKGKDGAPRMLAALLARQKEEAGHPEADVRGMPLGYPSLSPEDIQLLASWIDQGRPR